MIFSMAYYTLLGIPLVRLTGILALFLLILTIIVSFLAKKGVKWMSFKLHAVLAMAAFLLAIIHLIIVYG